jgi:hypothetical protein
MKRAERLARLGRLIYEASFPLSRPPGEEGWDHQPPGLREHYCRIAAQVDETYAPLREKLARARAALHDARRVVAGYRKLAELAEAMEREAQGGASGAGEG